MKKYLVVSLVGICVLAGGVFVYSQNKFIDSKKYSDKKQISSYLEIDSHKKIGLSKMKISGKIF